MSEPVLPPAPDPSIPVRLEDLLTPEQQAKLHADLAEMARRRRKAEAESGGLSVG